MHSEPTLGPALAWAAESGGPPGDAVFGFVLAAGLGALACALLVRVAPTWRWLDGARGPEAMRKLQSSPVPPVGGTAWLLAVLGSTGLMVAFGIPYASIAPRFLGEGPGPLGAVAPFGFAPGGLALGSALAIAFGTGLLDDARADGLRPRTKLLGQGLAALALTATLWTDALASGGGDPSALVGALLWTLGAVLAQNAFNTFDNSDGAAGSLGVLAFLGPAPLFAGALVGFLPFNLPRARKGDRVDGASPPGAYLGDSGSHLIGLALFVVPAAWPVFLLPGLDLLRVVVERYRAEQAPWIGDRRHLAHRMLERGASSPMAAACLAVIALPGILGVQLAGGSGPLAWGGAATTLLGFSIAVLATRGPRRPRGAVAMAPSSGEPPEASPRGLDEGLRVVSSE